MANFLFDLFANLAALGVCWIGCACRNGMRPDLPPMHGVRVYVVFAAIALVFDAILTFTVFADVQRYRTYGAPLGFAGRAAASAAVACGALVYSFVVRSRRQEGDAAAASQDLVIPTSAYTDSRLRM